MRDSGRNRKKQKSVKALAVVLVLSLTVGTISYAAPATESSVKGIVLEQDLNGFDSGYQIEVVEPKDLSQGGSVQVQEGTYIYTGQHYTPNVEVIYTDADTGTEETLRKDVDYTVSYEDNAKAGTASVIVHGTGDYIGTAIGQFQIQKNSLEECIVKIAYTQTVHDGNAKKPKITVLYNGNVLNNNQDYEVVYTGNTSVGTAKATVKGINSWEGQVVKTFALTFGSVKKITSELPVGQVKLTWDSVAGAKGYEVYRSTSKEGTYTKIATVSGNGYVDEDVEYKKNYNYKVRAYYVAGGKNVYSQWSEIHSISTSDWNVDFLRKYVGCRYSWGGTSPSGWDCSGFVMYAMKKHFGISLPRVSRDQAKCGKAVNVKDQSQWMPGDLIFFTNNGTVGHVGIYLGNGEMIHALSSRYDTLIQDVYYYDRWDGKNKLAYVRRVIK